MLERVTNLNMNSVESYGNVIKSKMYFSCFKAMVMSFKIWELGRWPPKQGLDTWLAWFNPESQIQRPGLILHRIFCWSMAML